ncbi:hypothetical protein SprV_0702435100 [Sparganum proliferum]
MKYNPSDSNYLNFLASFESIITSAGLTAEEQFTIRNSTVHALKNRNKFSTLSGDEKKALNSLKTDENIIILPADKGGSTTIMNKTDYTDKMMTLLKDESTYERLDADPTKSQNSCIEKTLKRLTGKKLISGDLAKSLKQDEPTIAKIHGLPKVHKVLLCKLDSPRFTTNPPLVICSVLRVCLSEHFGPLRGNLSVHLGTFAAHLK